MDFRFTEEQLALQQMVRNFVKEVVTPAVLEQDQREDPAAVFDWEVIKKASAVGLRTLCLPEEWGGGGVTSNVTICLVFEELAKGERGLAGTIFQTNKLIRFLSNPDLITEEQQKRFLPGIRDDDTFLIGAAMTEPNAGSDNFLPYDSPNAGQMLRAERSGNIYRLNGIKHFTANGRVGKLFFVFARTDRERGVSRGSTCFLVPVETKGFRFGRTHNKMGNRFLQNAELIFEDAEVPIANRVGEENMGVQMTRQLLRGSGLGTTATILGPAERAYEEALRYAKDRVQGGKPIVEHQLIGAMLADMFVSIESIRSLMYRCAWAADTGEGWDPALGIMTKVYASETCIQVCLKAIEIFGGTGYMKDSPVEKLLRDSVGGLHVDGTAQVNRIKAARLIGQVSGETLESAMAE